MKNTLLIIFALVASILSAQVPEGINYQAAIRNTNGDAVESTLVSLQLIIHQGTATGTAIYTETQNITTSNTGVASIVIGQGTSLDDFSTIGWSTNSHFLEVLVDVAGGTSYSALGTQQLMSVPYALHAKTSEVGDNLGNHTATQNIDLNTNSIAGVNTITTGTIFSTAANANIHAASLSGTEGIILPGSVSDYTISVEDGNGRVQHKWNATHGTNETFTVGGEDAAFIDINVAAANDNSAWLEFKHADGSAAAAGDAISWNTQMIINQGGEVGINETSPDDMLHITSAGNGTRVRAENSSNGWAGMIAKNTEREVFIGIQGAFDANPGEFHIFDNTAGSRRLVIDAAGQVGIGKNNPSVKLDVNGSVNCTGGTCSSDKRWKREIKTLNNVLANIKELRGVSYYWKTEDFPDQNFTDDKQIGLIAQEVEQIYPELIKTNDEGFKSMDYMSLTAILLEGLKAQQKEIESLNALNKKQLEENKKTASRLDKIERFLATSLKP